ncbi:hypothetical protein Q1695_011009 [Nippostrongylus brasiliensis]|nr:hypothetical protein Q1695_011009 [Nippostrongylus brasiliensis]
MNVNLAITMTCMINSTAISLLERSPIDNYTDNFDNVTELIEHVQAAEGGGCSARGEARTVLDYGGSLIWDHSVQNLLFSASFWGAMVAILPAILFVQHMNKKITFMFCVLNKNLSPRKCYARGFLIGDVYEKLHIRVHLYLDAFAVL